MNESIDILIVEPEKPPRPASVQSTAANFQAVVDGPLEVVCKLPKGGLLVTNQNAEMRGLAPNRLNPVTGKTIMGTFFLCGYARQGFCSLTPIQLREYQSWFSRPGEFMLVGANRLCATPNELLLAAYQLWDGLQAGETVVLTKWGGEKAEEKRNEF